MNQKRIRSLNWDEEEKQLFRSVLKEYAQIIENKSLDTNTNKVKTKAWEEVHKKFNELNSRQRQLSQLKIQWKTMKINARKSRKDHDEYVYSMLSHSKMLKDKEHKRRMEMAEEEHAMKMEIQRDNMAIHKEKLKIATLEREILELKKKQVFEMKH